MTTLADTPPVPTRRALIWRVDAVFWLVALHGALSVVLAFSTGYPFDPRMAGLLATVLVYLVPWFVLVLLVRRVILLAVVDKSTRPLQDMSGILKSLVMRPSLWGGGAIRLVLISFFIGSFGFQKELVAVLNPFSWDVALADLDRVLHFGVDPYALLVPVFGSPLATTSLNVAYHAWFFLIYFVTFVACFARRDHAASAAFLSGLVLTFAFGGNGLATAMSSAGPVYFERMGLGDTFVPLMTLLADNAQSSPVWALQVQEDLWSSHLNDGVLAGISAMPSMHVATSVLMALYAAHHARWAGWIMWIFAALILIGSVHLGWHYAVDGYLGGIVAWGAWRAGLWLAAQRA
jgi:hypothetical protein